jgi:hypothetical protein
MLTQANNQELVVWTEKNALEEAKAPHHFEVLRVGSQTRRPHSTRAFITTALFR